MTRKAYHSGDSFLHKGGIVNRFMIVAAMVILVSACGREESSWRRAHRGAVSAEGGSRYDSAHPISAQELVRMYEVNEVSADGHFKGIVLDVTGVVDKIGKDILDNPYVILKSSNDSFRARDVQAVFDKKDEAALSRLMPGQTVTVRGRNNGLMMNVILSGCEMRETGAEAGR
jgi:hypothetical protein